MRKIMNVAILGVMVVGFLFQVDEANAKNSFHTSESEEINEVVLYFFHGDGCPHCEEEIEWLNEIRDTYPNLVIKEYEVWYNTENSKLLDQVRERMNEAKQGVPFTVVGDKKFLGFNSATGNSIEKQIRYCSKHEYVDIVESIVKNREDIVKGEELETKEETKEKEEVEESKIKQENMNKKVWNPLLVVVGVACLCGIGVLLIKALQKNKTN